MLHRRIWLLLVLVSGLALPAAAAPTLAERAAAIDLPRVGPVVDVGDGLQVGRGTFRAADGTAVRLLLAGDEPVGVLFDGPVALRYTVEDRFSVPVARRNLDESPLSGAERDGELIIETTGKAAAVWSWRLAARLAAGAPGDDGAEGDDGGQDGADPPVPASLLDLVSDAMFSPPSNDLLQDRALAGEPGVAYAVFDGGEEDLLLWVDPRLDGLEGLYGLSTLTARYTSLHRGSRILYTLAVQPVGRQWWEPTAPPLRSVHQSLRVVNPADQRVEVTSRTTVRAERGGSSLWRVDLEQETSDGDRLHPVEVRSVKVDGEAAAWLHQGDELLVDLGRELAAGASAEVEVVSVGELAVRPNKDSYWYLSIWPWRPMPAWNAEYATFDIEVAVPEPFVPFASGDVVERSSSDGMNSVRTRVAEPMQFPVVAAGKYHLFSEQSDGLTCNVATYVFGKEKPAKVLQGLFFSAADIFERFFGVAYPFAEVDVVEINQWGFGQAPPGVIFITQEAYNPLSSTISRIFSSGVNARFVHEVAHAWWAHVIKMGSLHEQWLTESFAEYSAALAMQAMQPGKRGDREFNEIVRGWKKNTDDIGAGASIYLANYLDTKDLTDIDRADRYRLLYNKGPLVLHALRQELGRQTGGTEKGDRYFQALLRTFTTNFTNQFGETRHLVGILNQMTGKDWQPWFERYVYGTDMPPVEVP